MGNRVIPVTPFDQNCSLVWCDATKKAVVIDPGGDVAIIMAAIAQTGVTVEKIILTHGHLDHVGGSAALAAELNIPVWGPHPADQYWLDGLPRQSQMFGFPLTPALQPNQWLQEGEVIACGERQFEVIHCPGHTPGHVVLFDREAKQAWVGDVLFAGSVGRSDFPGGDHDTLVASIRDKLFPLGDDVRFIPGHGPDSTFGEERRSNPFVADRRFG